MKPVFEKVPKRDWESFHCEIVRGRDYGTRWHFHPEFQITLALQSSGQLGKIKLAVIMDMIGYSSTANSLDVLLETSSALAAVLPAFEQAAADYVPQLQVSTSLAPFGSDHVPFINQGVPSLLLIENEWDSYPHYHRSTDTPGNVSNAQLQGPAVLRMELAVIASQAEVELPGFANGFE